MKIVQTLWVPEIENPVTHKAGWLSPEYHWMSWALSCLLLREHYDEVVLYTTKVGRELLIEKLSLPYTEVHILPDNRLITSENWALSKLITYRHQTTPFLHVDGDVFIWKPFPPAMLDSALIAQNIETNRMVYEGALQRVFSPMQSVADTIDTSLIPPNTNDIMAYNAGILGGYDLGFIEQYTQLAIHIAEGVKKPDEMDTATFCMLFEQYVFARLTQKHGKTVTTFFDEPIADICYAEFADFWQMREQGYCHLMGQFKQKRHNLNLLAGELRQQYPQTYYRILNVVRAASIPLDNKVYELPELDLRDYPVDYFVASERHYEPDYILTEPVNWLHYYAKDAIIHRQLSAWLNLTHDLIDKQLFAITTDFWLLEETEPELKQQIKFPDTRTLDFVSVDLDAISMVLLDALCENEKTINQLIQVVAPYFPVDDINQHSDLLRQIIRKQVRQFMTWGVVRYYD